jgi:hypothetical protein
MRGQVKAANTFSTLGWIRHLRFSPRYERTVKDRAISFAKVGHRFNLLFEIFMANGVWNVASRLLLRINEALPSQHEASISFRNRLNDWLKSLGLDPMSPNIPGADQIYNVVFPQIHAFQSFV